MPVNRRLAPLLLVLTALAACSGEADGSPEDFRARAASHCTDVVNEHLLREPNHAGVEVIAATRNDGEPAQEQVSSWAAGLQGEVDRLESIQEALGELSPDDPDDAAHWQTIVSGSDAEAEALRARLQLLEEDWDEVRDQIEPMPAPSDDIEEALAALDLGRTDCHWVYAQAVVEPGSEDFVRDATTTCTEIANRRQAGGYAADADASLDVVLAIVQDGPPEELPTETAEALNRLHEEWVQTVDDLESVDPESASDPGVWSDTLDAARERAEISGDRAAAAESGDQAAIAEAFEIGRGEHPGPAFAELGLDNRSCAGVSF